LDFSKNTGLVFGAIKHIEGVSKNDLLLDSLSEEALKTSEIEEEKSNIESVQSAIKRNVGFTIDNKKIAPAELHISEMIVDLYKSISKHLHAHN